MFIEIEETTDLEKWDKEVERLEGSIFLSYKWLNSLRAEDKTPIFLLFLDRDIVVGLIGGLVVSLAKGEHKQILFYSGVAFTSNSNQVFFYCKKALMDYAKRNGFARLIFRSYDYLNFGQIKLKGLLVSKRRTEFTLNLRQDKERIAQGFSRSFKKQVRKGKKGGAKVKIGYSGDLLNRLFELIEITYNIRKSKEYGDYTIFVIPFLDRDVMERLLANGLAKLFYVEYKGNIVSMQFVIACNGRIYGLFMGTNWEGYSISAPSLVCNEIINYFREEGYYSYNLGGVPAGEKHDGVRKFKLSMGATPVESYEESTDFLLYPLKMLNFILLLKRHIDKIRIPWKAKKMIFGFLNRILKMLHLKGHLKLYN